MSSSIMSPGSVSLLLCLSLLPQNYYCDTRTCTSAYDSNCASVSCAPNQDCFVNCNVDYACKGSYIYCENDGYACNIACNSFEACSGIHIEGKNSKSLSVTTSETPTNDNLERSFILCPNSGDCSLQCHSGWQQCHQLEIDAESASSLNVTCSGSSSSCNNMKIWCPLNGGSNDCIIKSTPNTFSLKNITIRSQNGFNGVTVIGDNQNSVSIGRIFCESGYSAMCIIDNNDNNICAPNEPTVCNEGATPSPTTSTPSSTPTTTAPTTTVPTTTVPTIFPTTSLPTTVEPTTNIPSTSIPTTNEPTTQIQTIIGETDDYQITIEIDSDDKLDVDVITDTVLNALNNTNVVIISTTIGDDNKTVIILISIASNDTLTEDIIQNKIENGLHNTEYGDDISVKVEEMNGSTSVDSDEGNKIEYILIPIISFFILVICVIFIIWVIKKKRRINIRQKGQQVMHSSPSSVSLPNSNDVVPDGDTQTELQKMHSLTLDNDTPFGSGDTNGNNNNTDDDEIEGMYGNKSNDFNTPNGVTPGADDNSLYIKQQIPDLEYTNGEI